MYKSIKICVLLNQKKSALREYSKCDDIYVEFERDKLERLGSNNISGAGSFLRQFEINDDGNVNASVNLSLSDL